MTAYIEPSDLFSTLADAIPADADANEIVEALAHLILNVSLHATKGIDDAIVGEVFSASSFDRQFKLILIRELGEKPPCKLN